MKKYNFNAGPSMLPREVVEQTAAAVLDYDGTGLSLMELSHRSAQFKPILDEARALLKELLDVAYNHGRVDELGSVVFRLFICWKVEEQFLEGIVYIGFQTDGIFC